MQPLRVVKNYSGILLEKKKRVCVCSVVLCNMYIEEIKLFLDTTPFLVFIM